MHGRRQAHDRRPDSRFRERDHRVFRIHPRTRLDDVCLRRGSAQPGQHQRARRGDQRLTGARERIPDRLGGAQVGGYRASEVAGPHRLVLERQVDDAVRFRSGLGQAVDVVEVAAVHLRPGCRERNGSLLGASQPDDMVASLNELGNQGGSDVSGRSGDEDAHSKSLPSSDVSCCHHSTTDVSYCHHVVSVA